MKDPNALTDPAKYIDWRRSPRDLPCLEKLKAGMVHLTNAEWSTIQADCEAIDAGHKVLVLDECGCCFVAKTKMGTLTYVTEVDYKDLYEREAVKMHELKQHLIEMYETFFTDTK